MVAPPKARKSPPAAKSTKPAKTTKAPAAPAPQSDAQVLPADLKKKELIEAVTAATGQKRSEVKLVIEATLASLGRELTAGRSVQTPELGRLKVVKTKDTPGGPVAICRFRGPKAKAAQES